MKYISLSSGALYIMREFKNSALPLSTLFVSVVMLSVVMLSVVMLSVVSLSVTVPSNVLKKPLTVLFLLVSLSRVLLV